MAFPKVGLRAVIEGLARFNRDTRLINQRLKEVTGNVQKTEKASRKLGATIEAWDGPLRKAQFALFGMAAAGTAFLAKATLLSARVETLGVVTETLGKNVGKTKDEIRDLEQAVTDQGITLRAARTSIALMIQSQIDLTNAVDLAAEAQNAAVIAGIDSSEAFRRLVFVITSGNVRMARTLGLQVSFQDAYKKTAEELDKTTLELTQFEKVQSRTAAVLAAGTTIQGAYNAAMETTGKKLTSLPRHLEEVTRIMGEGFVPILGEAVDKLTAFLQAIEDAEEAQQRGQAAILSSTIALAGMGGATIFLIRRLPALITLLRELGLAASVAAGAVGLIISLFAVGVVGVVKQTAEIKSLKDGILDLRDTIIRNEGTFNDFKKAFVEAAEGTSAYNLSVKEAKRTGESLFDVLARNIGLVDEVGRAAFDAAAGAALADRKFFAMAEAAANAEQPLDDLAQAELDAAAAAEKMAEKQEVLRDMLSELQLQIDTDITPQFEDFKDEIGDINDEIAALQIEKFEALAELEAGGTEDLERHAEAIQEVIDRREDERERLQDLARDLEIAKARLSEMNDETSEASRLAAENRIGDIGRSISDARENIGEMTADILELQGSTDDMVAAQGQAWLDLSNTYDENAQGLVSNLDEVTAAWDRQTAQMLFNLATQRIGPDPTREQVEALKLLAGPEGLGLIDEAGVALLDFFDESIAAMDAAGDQTGLFADDMVSLAEILADPTLSIGEMAAAIRDLESAAASLSADPMIAALLGRGFEPANFPGGFIRRHRGGDVRRGEPYLVGKSGSEELFVPNQSGVILPQSSAQIPVSGAQTSISNSRTEQNFNMTIHSQAQREQIEADFNLLALRGERRG